MVRTHTTPPSTSSSCSASCARDLRRDRAVAGELELHADLEAEVHDARHRGLAGAVLGRERDRDVVRADQRLADLADRAEEAHHEPVRGLVVELARAADLLDPAVVHDRDPVGDGHRLLLVVRDQDGRDVDLVVQPAQPLAQLGAHLGVERAERLVEQQHLRLDRERAGERHALALAAGELVGVALLVAGEPDDLEQLVDARGDPVLRLLADLHPERDVVAHGHVLERGVVLEHEADPAPLRRHPGGVVAADHDRAGVRLLQPRDDAQQRGLAGAARAQQRRERAVGDLERHAVERDEVAERLADLAYGDHSSSLRGLISVIASSVPSAMNASSADAA